MQFWKYMTADDTGGSGQSLIQSALNDKLVEEIGICQGETFKEKEETDGLTLLIICACITTALGLSGSCSLENKFGLIASKMHRSSTYIKWMSGQSTRST